MGTNTSANMRTAERRDVSFETEIFVGDQVISCRILNISVGGARLKTARHFEHASEIVLSIDPFGKFPSDIVWTRGDIIGIKFQSDPLLMAEVVMAMAVY